MKTIVSKKYKLKSNFPRKSSLKFYHNNFKALFYYFSIKEILFSDILTLEFDENLYCNEINEPIKIIKNRIILFKTEVFISREDFRKLQSFSYLKKFEQFYNENYI